MEKCQPIQIVIYFLFKIINVNHYYSLTMLIANCLNDNSCQTVSSKYELVTRSDLSKELVGSV